MATPLESKSIVTLQTSFKEDLVELSVMPDNPWNERMCKVLESTHKNTISHDLEYYSQSLRTQIEDAKDKIDWEHLKAMVLSHVKTIQRTLYKENITINSVISHLLEDILSIYGTTELNLLQLVFHDSDPRDLINSEQFTTIGLEILERFKYTFNWMELHVVHCLLKMKYNRRSEICANIIKYMYQQILFVNKIPHYDDVTLCGYYLLFCKYKKFFLATEHSSLLLKLFKRFLRKPSYLDNLRIFKDISNECKRNSGRRVKMVTLYFKYIKEKGKLRSEKKNNSSCIENDLNCFHYSAYEENGEDSADESYSTKEERIISFVDLPNLDTVEPCSTGTTEHKHDEKKIFYLTENEEIESIILNKHNNNLNSIDPPVEEEHDITFGIIPNTEEDTESASLNIPEENSNEHKDMEVKTELLSECKTDMDDQVEIQEDFKSANIPITVSCQKEEHTECEDVKKSPDVSEEISSKNNMDVEADNIKLDSTSNIINSDQHTEIEKQTDIAVHEISNLIYQPDILTKIKSDPPSSDDEKNDEIVDETMVFQQDNDSQNNLINQLQEYLNISKSESVLQNPIDEVEESEKLKSHENMKEDIELSSEPLNLDINQARDARQDTSIDQQLAQSTDEIYNVQMHANDLGSHIIEESNKYIYEFGYETPPKDGNAEHDFHIVANELNIETDGFLTPENEPTCNLLPLAIGDIRKYDRSSNYQEPAAFYPVSVSAPLSLPLHTIHMNNVYSEQSLVEKTLDLRIKSRRNSADIAQSIQQFREVIHSKTKYNPTREKNHAITFKGGLEVQKYICNENLIKLLQMPSQDILKRIPQHSVNKKYKTARKIKKQTIAVLDMDIDNAFAEVNTKHQNTRHRVFADPKLPGLKPVVDILSLQLSDKASISKGKEKKYIDDDFDPLVQTVKLGTETRLPFKKRRMAVPEKEATEISYPATPMVSIAELEAIQQSNNQLLPLPVPNTREYLSELVLRPSPVAVEVNYNLNTYSYDFVPCASPYFEVNSDQPVQYCYDSFDSKENRDMNLHYFRTESVEP